MKFFGRKNKKFDYQARYYKGEGNPYSIEHKFDKFRSTVGGKKNLKTKVGNAINELKNDKVTVEYGNETFEVENSSNNSGKVIIFIIVMLFLGFLFIIDFDLSIFYTK